MIRLPAAPSHGGADGAIGAPVGARDGGNRDGGPRDGGRAKKPRRAPAGEHGGGPVTSAKSGERMARLTALFAGGGKKAGGGAKAGGAGKKFSMA